MNLVRISCLSFLLLASAAFSDPAPIPVTPLSYLRTCSSVFRRTFFAPFRTSNSLYRTARVSWLSSLIDLGGVFYLSKKQQAEHEIDFDPARGLWKFVETGKTPGNRKHEFVMLADGRILFGAYHHSALSAGMEIAAGGHMQFTEAGKLIYLSTSTGHYWENFPNSDLNWQQFVLEWLKRKGNPAGVQIYRQQAPDFKDFIELTSEDVSEVANGTWSRPHKLSEPPKPLNPS